MSRVEKRDSPRAIVHKRILDVAEADPEASLEAIADDIAGATPALVERVLEEYGDPAGAAPTSGQQGEPMSQNGQTAPTETAEPADLTEKQRETLRLVHENPEATQAAIAGALDVTRATVSRRLGDVPGFEWTDRAAFTADLFDDDPGSGPDLDAGSPDETDESGETNAGDGTDSDGDDGTAQTSGAGTGDGADGRAAGTDGTGGDESTSAVDPDPDGDALARFDDRLAALEDRVESDGESITLDPDLAHRVVHACIASDRISEDEELQLLRALLE